MSASREAGEVFAGVVNRTSGSRVGLTCPFDLTRLEATYSTDLTIRVRCTGGMLRDGVAHEFSLPVRTVEAHYRRLGRA